MINSILKRRSNRVFEKQPLSHNDSVLLSQILTRYQEKMGPFGNKVSLFDYKNKTMDNNVPIKIGTYGFIQHAPHFVGGACTNEFNSLVDFGYVLEHVLLELTTIGLGSVWLGGTFTRKSFKHTLQDNEIVPAILAIGYATDKRTLRERIIRAGAKSNSRKPFDELFFSYPTMEPIKENDDCLLHSCLKLVQVGPSASNKQPWRIGIEESLIHFYLERTPNYASILPYDIQALDIGIAICHVVLGLMDKNIQYSFEHLIHKPMKPTLTYVISIRIDT